MSVAGSPEDWNANRKVKNKTIIIRCQPTNMGEGGEERYWRNIEAREEERGWGRGGREGRKEGGLYRGREGGKEGRREGGKEGRREGGKEGRR